MSQMSISGAVSGLDTASIVNQLVAVQRNQQTLLKNQQGTAQKAADAYKALLTSVKALGTQARDVARTADWQGTTATSSSTSVTATATGTRPASLSFDVVSVAKAHALVSGAAVASRSATVAAGPLTLTRHDGTTATIPVGTGSLDDVVDAVNAAGEGLRASAVQTAPGQYRLQVTATTTGAASQFSLDGFTAGLTGDPSVTDLGLLRAASDARITVGDSGGGGTTFDVVSATNTFTDVVPGLSFTVTRPETAVTVGSSVDGTAVADKVAKLVDAANALLSDVAAKSTYDASAKTGGPLAGDRTARSLQQAVLSAVGGGGAAGVSLTRDGKVTFDRASFLSAFADDPAAVAQGYGANLSFAPAGGVTSGVRLVGAADTVRAGTYAIGVSASAAREQWRLDPPGGNPAGLAFTVTRGGVAATYTAGAGETLDDTAAALNTRLADAGLGITARSDGTGLVLTADAAGSAAAFGSTLAGVAGTRVTAGRDVTGTIDGRSATGTGTTLALLEGEGGAVGLTVDAPFTAAEVAAASGAMGSVTFTSGLAQRLLTLVEDTTTSTNGLLSSAQASRLRAVKDYQTQIERWDGRLEAYRTLVTRQFTAMETALSRLKAATSSLAGLTPGTTTS